MFDSVDPRQSFPDLEKGILEYWKFEDIFKRSIRQREECEEFTFYDGPPFATGLPHYGHLLAGTIKDVIPRYQTMRGKKVQRRFGWDCHGLPIENLIEQEHGIGSKKEIEEKGVGWFNGLCRAAVQRYTREWRTVVERMGRWVDMDWDYRTMDPDYMESMWWAFRKLWEKEMVYEGRKAMHVCPRCVTPLSNFEVTQGYQDVTDTAVTWKFRLVQEKGTKGVQKDAKESKDSLPTFVLAWTTTPWSTLSTMGLSISPTFTYVKVRVGEEELIFIKDRLKEILKGVEDFEILEEFPGSALVGREYGHIAPWYGEISEVKQNPRAYHIFAADYVEAEEGTGIVTINGSYGEIDMEAAKKNGLPMILDVDMTGNFNTLAGPYAGMYVKEAEKKLVEDFHRQGLVWRREPYRHSYPHCWRCDTPLLNYATSSWFVKVEEMRERMLRNNAKTQWVPAHIKDGRFGKWLEGARDWAISRNRYWGTPLPIWRTDDASVTDVIGGREDLLRRVPLRFTKITVMRHAESEGNIAKVYQGQVPGTDLTRQGRAQAKEAADALRNQNVTTVYCSPLARTQQTAGFVVKRTGAKIVVDERLRELSFGEYEGKHIDFGDLALVRARREHKWRENQPESIYHFAGMETWQGVQERITSFLQDVIPKHRGEHIVVVTHADPAMNARHFFTGEDPFKISHQPYPGLAQPQAYYWDHERGAQMDLHKDVMDPIRWMGPPSKRSVDLTLVRHGESEWNVEGKIQGHTDNPLTEEGRRQAHVLARTLRKHHFDAIVSSDLSRAAETAKIIADALGIPQVMHWEELRERDQGEWVGRSVNDILAQYPPLDEAKRTLTFHHFTPKGGESIDAIMRRAQQVCLRLIDEYAGQKILVVGHHGINRAMHATIQSLSYKEACSARQGNAEAMRLAINPFFRRIPEVLDCWFESGSMPYAQANYPFAFTSLKAGKFPPGFPADFIAEGVDQTRAWFYTLMVLSTALFGESPFANVIVNGIVLAEDGKKMSKRLKNYPEPMEIVEKYGADAIRFTLMSSPAVRAEDLRISEKIIDESMRNVILPLWNTYSFFVTYANAAGYQPLDARRHSSYPLDQWIRAEVQDLANRMTKELDGYDLSATCGELHQTIDALTNWYVRLSRRRFAGRDEGATREDQVDALSTLYDVLLTLSQLLAPFCPFVAEAIYLNLTGEEHGSIHLTDWPEIRPLVAHELQLLHKTRLQRQIVSLGMTVRSEHTIKVRQPLCRATIAVPPRLRSTVVFSGEDEALLRQELNVKDLQFTDDPGTLAQVFAQVDARKVGPRLGAKVQEVIRAGKEGNYEQQRDGSIIILGEKLSPEEARIVYRGKEGCPVASAEGIVVSLDCELTDELKREGLVRDIIRAIQSSRKEMGLRIGDRVTLEITGECSPALTSSHAFIEAETNGTFGQATGGTMHIVVKIEDGKVVAGA